MDRVNRQGLFPRVEESRARRHNFKVKGKRFKRDLRDNFFTQSVVHVWNELPEEIVEAGTITTFKRHVDGYMKRKNLEGCELDAGKWDEIYFGYLVGLDVLDEESGSVLYIS
eukprot:g11264.t1